MHVQRGGRSRISRERGLKAPLLLAQQLAAERLAILPCPALAWSLLFVGSSTSPKKLSDRSAFR